jgi:hypothetical protein
VHGRTDRVNEIILVREGVLRVNPNQINEDNFNTDAYLAGQYEGLVKSDLVDLNPTSASSGKRKVRMEDGILLPRYRPAHRSRMGICCHLPDRQYSL